MGETERENRGTKGRREKVNEEKEGRAEGREQ